MTVEKINLKHYSILPDRKKCVEEKIVECVKNSVIRKIFTTRSFDSSKDDQLEFRKLGISSITNKEWYVQMPGNTYYDWKPIPKMYADSIEEGEIKFVVEKLLAQIKEQNMLSEIVEDKNPLAANVFGKLLDSALSKLPETNLIMTNSHDGDKFFWLDKQRFNFNYQGIEKYITGTYDGVSICVSRMIPYGKTILLNTKEVGEFIIKKDITADLTEIKEEERPKIKETLNLTDEDLDSRVRILIEEVIQFTTKKPEAVVLVETSKGSEESKHTERET